jgi:multiple sugar transport system permease protein
MMATMMIPGQVTMIPYFLIIKSLGWYNTLTPLWVMSFTGNAFNIFLLVPVHEGHPARPGRRGPHRRLQLVAGLPGT